MRILSQLIMSRTEIVKQDKEKTSYEKQSNSSFSINRNVIYSNIMQFYCHGEPSVAKGEKAEVEKEETSKRKMEEVEEKGLGKIYLIYKSGDRKEGYFD